MTREHANVGGVTWIESAAWVRLIPVRARGSEVHYVNDCPDPLRSHTLCGQVGPLDRYGRPKLRSVHGRGGKVCNACHAASCAAPSRILW